jgi:hypothetical protein
LSSNPGTTTVSELRFSKNLKPDYCTELNLNYCGALG